MANVSGTGSASGLATVTGVSKMVDTSATLVTAGNLTAFKMQPASSSALANWLGDVCNLIKRANAFGNKVDGGLSNGYLEIPGRGVLKVLPGDIVAVDDKGWPVLISANSIANGASWTYTQS